MLGLLTDINIEKKIGIIHKNILFWLLGYNKILRAAKFFINSVLLKNLQQVLVVVVTVIHAL